MDMKYIMLQLKRINPNHKKICIIKIKRRGSYMVKFLAKMAEKYAKVTNTSCYVLTWFHEAKKPASLIKKD